MEEKIGIIIRIGNDGLGIILEEGTDGTIRPFTFDKIKGYRGESLQELKEKGIGHNLVVKFKIVNYKISGVRGLIWNR